MSEQTTTTKSNEQINKIDITQWIDRFLHSFRHLWWLVLILAIAGGAYQYMHVQTTYVPNYTAEATLTISATSEGQSLGSEYYTNTATAEELSDVFSSIVQSGILDDILEEDLGYNVAGSYNVSVIEGTNMLEVTASWSDGQTAYDILMAVIDDYPEVAQMVVGQTYPVLLDEPTVPEDTGKEYTSRGSAKKGAMAGLILGLIIILLDMVLQRTVRYQSDFTNMLHVSCLGMIPEIKAKKRKKSKAKEISILDDTISSGYLEAVRSLRSRVERQLDKAGEKTFMVTSSIPSEGKSTVSSNLAAAFARKGKRVVLIDCDLRHPSIQKNLSLEGEFPGLEKILKGHADFQSSLVKMPGMEMYVLPGASTPSENIDILASTEMKHLIEQAEVFADVVILDTSPSAMLADAITLANNCPMALYIVRADYAKVRHILDGIEELSETGITLMGCAMNYARGNGGSHGSSNYGYGRYGYGNYGYGKYGYGKYGYGSERSSKRRHKGEEEASAAPASPTSPAASAAFTVPAAPAATANFTIPAAPASADFKIPAAPAVQAESIRRAEEEDEQRRAEEARKAEEERLAEESRLAAEAARKAEEERLAEESRLAEEAARKAEEDRLAAEAAQKAAEEAAASDENAERIAELDVKIKELEDKIMLATKMYQGLDAAKAYQKLSGQEKKLYYRDHREELDAYNEAYNKLREASGGGKVPSLRTLISEREVLLTEKNNLQK